MHVCMHEQPNFITVDKKTLNVIIEKRETIKPIVVRHRVFFNSLFPRVLAHTLRKLEIASTCLS